MTCRLSERHPLDVLYSTCRQYPGGIEMLAVRIGCAPSTLYNKLRTSIESHRIGYSDELSEILHALRDAKLPGWADTLSAFAARHDFLLVPKPTADDMADDGIYEITADTMHAAGVVLQAVADSVADRKITPGELEAIERATHEAMTALATLTALAKAMHHAQGRA